MRKPVRLVLVGLAALSLASGAIPARAGSFIHAPHVGARHGALHPKHLRHHAHHGPRASFAHRPHAVHVWVPVVDSFALHTERDFVRERDFVGSSAIESDGGVTIVIESAGSDDGTEVITIILR